MVAPPERVTVAGRIARRFAGSGRLGSRRVVVLLGGTTTLGHCLVALRYLARPPRLVRGAAIAEYERAFARQIGVRSASSPDAP